MTASAQTTTTTTMTTTRIFAEARHVTVLRRMHLIREKDRPEALRRVLIIIAVGWVPLMVLCLIHTQLHKDATALVFFGDIAVHARLLLAAPLLVLAEYIVLPRLESIRQHFSDASLIAEEDHEQFQIAVQKCHRMSSRLQYSGEIAFCAYALAFIVVALAPRQELPAWQLASDGYALSLAGWWHLVISLPLLLGLILGWLWRLVIWTRFLAAVARLGLRMVAAHPDRAAGLQFIAYSPRMFSPVGFAMSIVVAGTMANGVLHHGISPLDHPAIPVVTAAVIAILFLSPPFIFTRLLVTSWRQAVFKYGDLATRLGKEFEEKWIGPEAHVDSSALSDPDFSATTDLYSIVSNVYNMRPALFDYQGAIAIIVAALLPFVPVWLTVIPLKTLSKDLIGLLF
jgi:hypothetical protein